MAALGHGEASDMRVRRPGASVVTLSRDVTLCYLVSRAEGRFRACGRAGRFGTRQIRHLKKGPTGIANNGDQWGTGESSSAFKVLVIWFYPRKNARKQVLAVGQK